MQNIIYVICVVTFISLAIATFIDLEKLKNSPDMMQGIGMALLTILIPLGIVVFTDVHKKRRNQNIGFAELDLHVVTDEVFNFWRLLLYVALIFLPTIFWEVSTGVVRFIEISSFGVGISLFGMTLRNIYSWIKGPFEFRFSYLRSFNNNDDLEAVWCSVWQAKNTNSVNESEFFKIFSTDIDLLLKTDENSKITPKLLYDFKYFINNRLTFSLVEKIFPKILEWHYRNEKIYFNAAGKSVFLYEIRQVLSSIIEMIEERALKEDASRLFFPCLKKHWEIHRNEKEYLEHLLAIFYNIFFENIGNIPVRKRYDIWKYFQSEYSEWTVTKENLEGENNLISRISLVCFLNWAQERIRQAKEEFDSKLDDVSCNLFPEPEVEPTIWAKILIFCLKPFGNNRIKDVIEHPCNFGKSRVYRGDGEGEGDLFEAMKSQIKSEKRNTFELTVKLSKYYPLFKDISTEENLEGYIKDLEALEGGYKNDSSKEAKEKESKRLELLRVFTEMREFLHDREKQIT